MLHNGGPRATAATVRHETFHALWRFAKASMDKADVEALYSHFPQIDKENDLAKGGVGLDEAMAHEFEKYASGEYVSPTLAGKAEKAVGGIVRGLGGLLDALKIGRADSVGKDLTLKGFYDQVLAGKLGSGALGVEMRKVEPSSTVKRMNAAPETGGNKDTAANGDSGQPAPDNQAAKPTGGGETVEGQASNAAPSEAATLEKPAASNVPGQRFYRLQAGEGVWIVGELVVSDVDSLRTSDKGNLSDATLQNRMGGKEREGRINQIAARPNPRLMGTVNEQASGGFVWALPNGDVFIGNTRTTGATEAYARGTADELREYMIHEADARGIEIPEGVTRPLVHFVLRRIESADGKATIQDVVRMTNESTVTEMTSLEKAKNDADVVEKESLAGAFAFRADGRIDETKSGDAIGRFRQATRAVGLVGDKSGMLTKEGQERIFGALLAHFLKGADAATVEKAIGQTEALDMENEMRALVREASALETLAKVKPRFDLRDAVAEILPYYMEWLEKDAAKRAETGKGRGESAKRARRSWEAFMSQGDMFRQPSEAARIVGDLLAASRELRSFDKEDAESDVGKQRAQRFVMDYLDAYARNAAAANDEVDMFGTPPATREDLMRHHRATGGADGGARFSVDGAYNPRSTIPNVRGGWNEKKILQYLKANPSRYGVRTAARLISEFDTVDELKDHMFYHGTRNLVGSMQPSMTQSERWAQEHGGGGYGQRYWGISVSKSKKVASNFGNPSPGVSIYPVVLAKGAKVIDRPDLTDAADVEDHIAELWNDGVDAVRLGDWSKDTSEQELLVLNPRAICNIGTADSYRYFKLGSDENPLDIKDDAHIARMLEAAREYADYSPVKRFGKPVRPSLFYLNGTDGTIGEMKPREVVEAEKAQYEKDLAAWRESEQGIAAAEYEWKMRDTIRFSVASEKKTTVQGPLSESDQTPPVQFNGGATSIPLTLESADPVTKFADSISQDGAKSPADFLTGLVHALGSEETNPDKTQYFDIAHEDGKHLSLRVANHRATAAQYREHGNTADVKTSIVVKMSDKPFRSDSDVEMTEHVYFSDKLTAEREAAIANAVADWIATGEWNGPAADQVNMSPRRRYSIGGVYTGTAADYANRSRQGGVDDGPSVKHIGTGEGSQVYGWGLYGSTVRGVAEGYAETTKKLSGNLFVDGKKVDPYTSTEWYSDIRNRISRVGSVEETRKRIAEQKPIFESDKSFSRKEWDHLLETFDRHDWRLDRGQANVYEQTWFTNRVPGDESHLLKWYEPVSEEQFAVIGKAGLDVEEKRRTVDGETIRRVQISKDGELLLQVKDKSEITGQDLYGLVAKALGSPQAASEFLARADIDGVKYPVDSYGGKGVKDGDKAGWNYVSFRDDNIRVDHKWTDGEMRYSISVTPEMRRETTVDASDMTREKADAALRALAGRDLKNDETGIVAQVNSVQRRKILSNAAVRKSQDNGFLVNEHDAAASILETLWKVATLGKSDPDKNGDPALKSVKRFVAPVRLGEKDAYAYITAKESVEHGHRIYSIELEKLEALAGMFKERTPRAANASGVPEGTPQIIPQTGAPAQGGSNRYSISGVYTGTAADYANRSRQGGVDDGPSLKKIGTGEGSQVYGWGLYGSTVRGVAEGYASDNVDAWASPQKLAFNWANGERDRADTIKWVKSGIKDGAFDVPRHIAREALKILETQDRIAPPKGNLYEQTFFTNRAPGDESHLLKWYEDLPKEQVDWIAQEFAKEGFFVASFSKLKGWTILDRTSGKKMSLWDKRESGETYEAIATFLGSPQAASEFLARAGIDGVKYPVDSYGGKTVKDGDVAGWNYVSFRDDNIRVDHKWTDGQQRYSVTGGNALATAKLGEWKQGVDEETVRGAIADYIDKGAASGDIKLANEGEKIQIAIAANQFYKAYSDKIVMLSDGRCAYFAPDPKNRERGLSNAESWALYCVHAVTHGGKTVRGKSWSERIWSPEKAESMMLIEKALKDERCIAQLDWKDRARDRVVFVGESANGERMNVVTSLDEYGNINADLTEVTVVMEGGKTPPANCRPLTEAVEVVAIHQADGYSVSTSGIIPNLAPPAQLASAVAQDAAKREKTENKGGFRASVEAPRRAATPYPNLATMSDEDLVAAALAARIVTGDRKSIDKGPTTAHTYGGLSLSTVESYLRRVKPGASDSEIALMLDTTARHARDMARAMREDLDRGVSESAVVKNLDELMRDAFGREMAMQTNRGRRFGRFGAKAEDALAERQARIVATAVRNQTGIEAEVMENATGINLAESVAGILENDLNRPPQGAGAGQGELDNWGDPSVGAGGEFGEGGAPASVEEVSAKVKAAVDEMLAKTGAQSEADAERRRERQEAAERRREEDEADREAWEASGGGDVAEGGPGDVAAAVRKAKVELRNPRHLALFVVEFARRYWVRQQGMGADADPWGSAVAMQFLRKTAQDVYGKLVRTITYSRSRETSMRRVESFGTIPSVGRLVNEMEYVGALVNARRIKESAQSMCEGLDRLLKEKFGATGRFKADDEELRRAVPAELELRARYMRHVMWLTPEGCTKEAEELAKELAAAQAEFDEAGAAVEQSRTYAEAMRKVAMLREFGGLRYKRLAEIEAAVRWWQDAAEGGAREICDQWTDREERTSRLASVLAAAFRNPKLKRAVERSLAQTFGDYFHAHAGFTHLLRDLMRFAGDKERAEAERVVEWLELEVQKAGTRAMSEKRRMGEAFKAAVERIYGRKFGEVVKELTAEDARFAPFMGETDAGLRVMPTRARALQLYASLVQVGRQVEVDDPENPNMTMLVWQGGYHDNIVANGREGQAEELAKLLTVEDMNLIAWMRKWYEQNRKGLSDVSEALFGVGVHAETGNYMPVKMLLDPQGLEKPGGAAFALFPKALTPRVRNERDFDTTADILTMWGSRMEEAAQWKAHAELGLELRGIFGRAELQKAIVASHGRKAKNDVLAFVTDILAGHGNADSSADGAKSFIDSVRGWAALGALAGNVGVMMKQTTSIPAFGFEIGMVKTAKYVATALTPEGIAAMRTLWNSEERRNRWTGGNTEAVANALSDDNPSAIKQLLIKWMATNRLGDAVPGLVVGQGIYRDALGRGMTAEDAMAYTWMLVERTQQSSRVENRSAFQRRGKLGNIIYQFLTTQQQYLQYELRTLREVVADPKSARKWGGFLRAVTLNHFILSSAYYWMGELYKALLGQEPPEDRLADWVVGMLTGPYGALYGIGLTTADALREWIKPGSTYGRSGSSIPSLQWLETVAAKDPTRVVWDTFDGSKSWDDVLDDLNKWLSDFNATWRDLSKLYRYRVKEEPQKRR